MTGSPDDAARERLRQLINVLPGNLEATKILLARMTELTPDVADQVGKMMPALIGAVIGLERRIAALEGSTEALDQRLNESADLAAVLREIFPDSP
jgi:hypothetical protein